MKVIKKGIIGYIGIFVYVIGILITSLFLISQWLLTKIRQSIFPIKSKPYFKYRTIFAEGYERPIASNKNTQKTYSELVDYIKLNEGLGGCYERIAYTNIIKKLAKKYNAKKILELNSTFIAGIPAFNSSILVQDGYDVTITVHSRDYIDAVDAWKTAHLYDKVKIIEWNDDFKTNFNEGEFDIVWNHLAIEHHKDPLPLLKEMARISNKLVITMTLSPFNIGFPIHWLVHKLCGKRWDHGYFKNTLISTMERIHRQVSLELIESGGCDVPFSVDTVDAKMGESMTYLDAMPKFIKDRWIWAAINPKCQTHWIVRFFWFLETRYPDWFRRATAHHLYTASIK